MWNSDTVKQRLVQTNRQAHEEAAGMGLCPEFFALNKIDPDAPYVPENPAESGFPCDKTDEWEARVDAAKQPVESAQPSEPAGLVRKMCQAYAAEWGNILLTQEMERGMTAALAVARAEIERECAEKMLPMPEDDPNLDADLEAVLDSWNWDNIKQAQDPWRVKQMLRDACCIYRAKLARRARLSPRAARELSLQDRVEKKLLIEYGPEQGAIRMTEIAAEIIALVKGAPHE